MLGFPAGVAGGHLVAVASQQCPEDIDNAQFVIDYENLGHGEFLPEASLRP
jgi:hypothetical protein